MDGRSRRAGRGVGPATLGRFGDARALVVKGGRTLGRRSQALGVGVSSRRPSGRIPPPPLRLFVSFWVSPSPSGTTHGLPRVVPFALVL